MSFASRFTGRGKWEQKATTRPARTKAETKERKKAYKQAKRVQSKARRRGTA